MFRIIHEVLSSTEVEEVVSELKRASFRDGRETAIGNAKLVKSNGQLDQSKHKRLIQHVTEKVSANPFFKGYSVMQQLLPVLINRFGENDQYGSHIDLAYQNGMRSDLAFTLFLSDPASYDGGDLVVETELGEQAFKLPAGSMLLYPANRLHRVNMVTRGERFAAVSWIQSAIPDLEKRDLYIDLDLLLYRLREEKGVCPDTEQLVKVMNKLRHMWGRGG